MPTLNPVEERLQKIAEVWEETLADKNVRLVRFVGKSEDRDFFNAFLESETDENGKLPDLFLRFPQAFERVDSYVLDLVKNLSQFGQEFSAAASQDPEPSPFSQWIAPVPQPGSDPVDFWVNAVQSWVHNYGIAFEAFGFYLEPDSVISAHEWMHFLFAVAKHPKHPQQARHLVWDDATFPRLNPLCDADKVRIVSKPLDLDLAGAVNQLAAQKDDGSPGGTFRKLYTAVATSAGKGDMARAKDISQQAIIITNSQGWFGLEVAVYMALAAGYLGLKDHSQAYATYDKAQQSAVSATNANDPVGVKLEIQALAGKGSTRLAQGDFVGSGHDYEILAQKAEASGDGRMTLEGLRMAGYCREALKEWEAAFEFNGQAVKVAENMTSEERESSSLPYVGQALTRITQKTRKEQAAAVKAYIDKLMPGWENKIQRRSDTV